MDREHDLGSRATANHDDDHDDGGDHGDDHDGGDQGDA